MSHYRKIDTRIWYDDKFPLLDDDQKLLFFFLLSNPRGTMLGISVQGQSDIGEFLGWSTKRLTKPFRQLLVKGMFRYDMETRTLYLPKFLIYNPIENENQAKGAIKVIDSIPQKCPFLQDVKLFLERLAKPFLEPLLKRLSQFQSDFHETVPETRILDTRYKILDTREEKESNKEKENELIIFGEFKKVKLTQEQLEKLKTKFGEQETLDKIAALDVYMASKGSRKYEDHYATILNWDRMQQEKDKPGRI